jgi:hypothetical protein
MFLGETSASPCVTESQQHEQHDGAADEVLHGDTSTMPYPMRQPTRTQAAQYIAMPSVQEKKRASRPAPISRAPDGSGEADGGPSGLERERRERLSARAKLWALHASVLSPGRTRKSWLVIESLRHFPNGRRGFTTHVFQRSINRRKRAQIRARGNPSTAPPIASAGKTDAHEFGDLRVAAEPRENVFNCCEGLNHDPHISHILCDCKGAQNESWPHNACSL